MYSKALAILTISLACKLLPSRYNSFKCLFMETTAVISSANSSSRLVYEMLSIVKLYVFCKPLAILMIPVLCKLLQNKCSSFILVL